MLYHYFQIEIIQQNACTLRKLTKMHIIISPEVTLTLISNVLKVRASMVNLYFS